MTHLPGSEDRLFFLHIPKTAGTTLTHFLDQHFAHDEIFPPQIYSQLSTVAPESIGKYRLYRGHFNYDFIQLHVKQAQIITVLREPIDHIISIYESMRRDPRDLDEEQRTVTRSLAELLNTPALQGFYYNTQTYFLGGELSWGQLRTWERHYVKMDERWQAHFQKLNLPERNRLSETEVLERAKSRLETLACFGTTERFGDFLHLLAYTFGWQPMENAVKQNAAPSRISYEQLDSATRDRIDEVTALDRELYQFASSLFKKRYQQMVHNLLEERGKIVYQTTSVERLSSVHLEFSEQVLGTGWYRFEPENGGYRWTGPSNVSTLHLPLSADQDLKIEFGLVSAISSEVLNSLSLTVNGFPVELSVTYDGERWRYEGLISRFALAVAEPLTNLTFTVEKTLSPIEVGWNDEDARPLGVAFDWLDIRPAQP
jgi:hypothetical protein